MEEKKNNIFNIYKDIKFIIKYIYIQYTCGTS